MKSLASPDVHYLTCECLHPAHTIRVVYDPGSPKYDEDPALLLEVQFSSPPWYRRMWVALLYVLGVHETTYNGWTDHCLTEEGIVSLEKAIQKYRLVKALRQAIRAKKARKEARHGGQATHGVDGSAQERPDSV